MQYSMTMRVINRRLNVVRIVVSRCKWCRCGDRGGIAEAVQAIGSPPAGLPMAPRKQRIWGRTLIWKLAHVAFEAVPAQALCPLHA